MTGNAIKGKVIVITGASSGLGRGTALALAAPNVKLVLAARRTALLDQIVLECEEAGAQAIACTVDVGDEQDVERLTRLALATYGRIDVWINNAGVGALGVSDVPLMDHERIIRTNLLGTVYGSYAAMKQFRKQRSGTLINVASMLGKIPSPYYAAYNASKHGIIGLTHTIKHEIDEEKLTDIYACLVLPMALNTPFFAHAANYTAHKAVPIPPVAEVKHGIDALVKLIKAPRNDVIVGAGGIVSQLAHQMAPSLVEQMTAKMVHVTQDHGEANAASTSGNLFEPVMTGAGIHSDETKQP